MFAKILIANRGEIACRIIHTARKLGITTVAVYSDVDTESMHVSEADEAYYLGPSPALESYLNINRLISIAQKAQVDAVHPGYGFLSENLDFAKACDEAGICFIGPSLKALEIMASKQLAKLTLAKIHLPLIPGYHEQDQSPSRLLKEAEAIGYPLLIKAACGGGGKGMREVKHADEFLEALAGAKREAQAYFADDQVILEKLIENPKHIEIQIMADNFGQVVHLFERDCSTQRRHQKLIEEAPAYDLPAELRQNLADAAIKVAQSIDYRGAGTIECLVDRQHQFYFMEMNTRLQVEHPVTEMITGLDLVAWQIQIAAGLPLPLPQEDIQAQGHAIECRLYAEDPTQDCLPSVGQLRFLRFPKIPHLRIDTAMQQGSAVSIYYDPLVAKLIAWGSDREQAIRHLKHALSECHIGGVKTNLHFLQDILNTPTFIQGQMHTQFLSQHSYQAPLMNPTLMIKSAAAIDYAAMTQIADPLDKACFAWQLHERLRWVWRYRYQDLSYALLIEPKTLQEFSIQVLSPEPGPKFDLCFQSQDDKLIYHLDGQRFQHYFERLNDSLIIYSSEGPVEIHRVKEQSSTAGLEFKLGLSAPMPGIIVALLKKPGDKVKEGEVILVLEAMKMEHSMRAPHAGIIKDIFYPEGAQVQEGAILAAVEPS